jgi:hypothetical protein
VTFRCVLLREFCSLILPYTHTHTHTHTILHTYIYIYIYIYISKINPVTGPRCPEGSRKLRFPDFVTTAQDGS